MARGSIASETLKSNVGELMCSRLPTALPMATDASTSSSVSSVGEGKTTKRLLMPRPILVSSDFQGLDVSFFENGALLIDKPLEWTSFDVCGKLRNSLRFVSSKLKAGTGNACMDQMYIHVTMVPACTHGSVVVPVHEYIHRLSCYRYQ